MVRLILSGCNGKMGRVITACVAERCDCKIVAGFDINTESHAGYPVYANPANCMMEADVIIDFSHPSALDGVLAYAKDHRLMELARKAAAVLGGDFDVEIIEKHHNQKLDAPSGTALMLADAVSEGLSYTPRYVYERHSVRQKRDKAEIGISSVRGGTIVGEHEILFAGHDELITLSHTALSKEIFGVGAINAALFLIGREPGMYCMADLVDAAK